MALTFQGPPVPFCKVMIVTAPTLKGDVGDKLNNLLKALGTIPGTLAWTHVAIIFPMGLPLWDVGLI